GPEQVALIDTRTGELRLVDLGPSYSFRSVARGPHGEALVLGTVGAIHVIDAEKGEVVARHAVVGEWREPLDWQRPRPALFVRGHVAYVPDPAGKRVHAGGGAAGRPLRPATPPAAPDAVTGVVDGH